MATSIPIDDIDDRIIAIEDKALMLEALVTTIKNRVTALEMADPPPSPPGTQVILPIIGYHIVYTVPTP